ncbi:MAG: endonuclease NucS [Ignisphaera sp.]|nr:endonuclease NucS [Ignisphaera sp.]MCX8168169.1 endonuclease NucS [Ignisphaera sp.]MDW8085191.1 endonuclease NucS [Ignisphaera sp.]
MAICNEISIDDCKEMAEKLNNVKKDGTVIIVGKIVVEYVGRALSYATEGNRIVLLKPDGSLLVHESSGVEPLNWQPPKSIALFSCIENKLRIRSYRSNPHEEVVIDIIKIDFIKVCDIVATRLIVIGRESDIVNIIALNPSTVLNASMIVGTDVSTPYGKVDILLKDEKGNLIVVEVKNEKAGIAAVLQLKRYLEYYASRGISVRGVIVAPSITDEAMAMTIKEGFIYISTEQIVSNVKNIRRDIYSYAKFKT